MSIIAFSQVKNLKNGTEKEEVMALKTANEYLDTIKKMKPHVYIGGKWVKNLLDHPVTRSMVMANAAIYGQRESSTISSSPGNGYFSSARPNTAGGLFPASPRPTA
jgi:hypothetical protein